MKFDIVTIFPRMFDGPTREGILGRAIERGLLDLKVTTCGTSPTIATARSTTWRTAAGRAWC